MIFKDHHHYEIVQGKERHKFNIYLVVANCVDSYKIYEKQKKKKTAENKSENFPDKYNR